MFQACLPMNRNSESISCKTRILKKFGLKTLFFFFERLNYTSNYFLKGSGNILHQNNHSVRFTLDTSDAVLKFSWFPFLRVEGCRIDKLNVAKNIDFVSLHGCPVGRELVLKSVGLKQRLFPTVEPNRG